MNYPVYYLNLLNRKDRDNYFSNHLKENGIENKKRIQSLSPDLISKDILDQGHSWGMSNNETATTISHLTAIKYFLNNSDKQYAIICEDDADLTNLNKLCFNVEDLFNYFKLNIECFQLGVCTREDIDQIFKIKLRSFWDFNCSTYIITKDYAKKIIDEYWDESNFNLKNFKKEKLIEYRNGNFFYTSPTSESVVYQMTNTIVCPIVTFILTESSINFTSENSRQTSKSRKDFLAHWDRYDTITLEDLI
jgi:GR25 family glycosyltransferase involved in LPS biosynthesis